VPTDAERPPVVPTSKLSAVEAGATTKTPAAVVPKTGMETAGMRPAPASTTAVSIVPCPRCKRGLRVHVAGPLTKPVVTACPHCHAPLQVRETTPSAQRPAPSRPPETPPAASPRPPSSPPAAPATEEAPATRTNEAERSPAELARAPTDTTSMPVAAARQGTAIASRWTEKLRTAGEKLNLCVAQRGSARAETAPTAKRDKEAAKDERKARIKASFGPWGF
jgi:uncharacterized protein YbaR (Trm112 family)